MSNGNVLYLMVPQFGDHTPKELEEYDKERENYIKENLENEKVNYGITSIPKEYLLKPNITLRISSDLKFSFPKRVGKGTAVRLALFSLLWDLDTFQGPTHRNQAWIVMIDGTGAFPPDQIATVLDKLQLFPAVLGLRKDKWTDDDTRIQVEFFEKYLLEKTCLPKISPPLPDCQCGLWGIHDTLLDRIALSASDYGLEFDLTSSLIIAKIKYAFVPVKVRKQSKLKTDTGTSGSGRTPSTFRFEDAIQKLKFIIQKLRLSKDRFSSL